MVLRRPPKHLRAESNKTMMREARVVHALARTDVPHATVYAVCEDIDVIGAAFYIMEAIEGFTPRGELPGRYREDALWRRKMAFELVGAAARLGAIDPLSVGLGDFGRSGEWLARQVERWRSQLDGYSALEGYGSPQLPGVTKIGAWLESNRPGSSLIGIIHGDLQWANVMFASDEPRLVALIDWELSTLGDPLLDLGWILTSWVEAGDPPGRAPEVEPWLDFPTRTELIGHYGTVSGRDMSHMPWYFVLACYKLGVLLEGTHARSIAGKAPLTLGRQAHEVALWLFQKAEQLLDNSERATVGLGVKSKKQRRVRTGIGKA